MNRQIVKASLIEAMARYSKRDARELVAALQGDRIVEQIESNLDQSEAINITLELHPEFTDSDDPASIWISAKYGSFIEYGVLLAFRNGTIEVGKEFRSLGS